MADEVTKILKEMGRKSNILLSACNNKVNQLRTQIMASQRRNTLAPICQNTSLMLALASELPAQQNFRDCVFNPVELQSFLGFAQMTQNTGFLLCFICENPEDVASAVLKKMKHKSFPYIVNCAIPAVFGYFASKEHVDIAIRFYKKVAVEAPGRSSIFAPLLHSAATFRFMELILTEFTNALVIDINLGSENQMGYVPIYSTFLAQCIQKAVPLLPLQILELFRVMKDAGWGLADFTRLFFHDFLIPSLIQSLRSSSARTYEKIVCEIIKHMMNQKELKQMIFSSLFTSNSCYELPEIYRCFGQQYMEFYVCVHDIHVIAKILDSCKLMPDTVTFDELMRVPKDGEYHWYSCQVYPRLDDDPKPPVMKLFDGNTPEIRMFEKLMTNTLFENGLHDWLAEIQSLELFHVCPFIQEEAYLRVQNESKTFMTNLMEMKAIINIPRLGRCIYIALVEAYWKKWLSSDILLLDHLDKQFSKLRKSSMNSADKKPDFQSLLSSMKKCKGITVNAIRELACLDNTNMYKRFTILIEVMKNLQLVQEREGLDDSIYPIFFKHDTGKAFLSTFILLNNFAMRNPEFMSLCSDDEKVVWLKLESAILITLNPDEVFLKGYITIQDKFTTVALQNII